MAEPRIAIVSIALNEERHAERFVRACAEADLVLVADTGSRDATVPSLRAAGAAVHTIGIKPWRFDDARNAALALVPTDIDICVALDLDEIPNAGFAAMIRAAWKPGTTRGRYLQIWTHPEDGSPGMRYVADRVHARHGYRWRHACHEALYPDRITEHAVRIEGMRVDHWPDNTKSRGHYMEILEAAAREVPDCSRSAFNLGREWKNHGRYAEGEAELMRYLAMPDAKWDAQNASAMRMLAACRRGQDDPDGELDWLRRSAAEAPREREAWLALARALYRRTDWLACDEALSVALDIGDKPNASIDDASLAGAFPHDLAAIVAYRLDRPHDALSHARDAAALAPWDERITANVAKLERRLDAASPIS